MTDPDPIPDAELPAEETADAPGSHWWWDTIDDERIAWARAQPADEQNPAKRCHEFGEVCDRIAGTPWGPFWCHVHDAERLERLKRQFAEIQASFTDG